MSKKEAEFLEELRSLSITAAHELLSGFDRLKQLRDDFRFDEYGHGDESRKSRERAKSLAFELARLEIKHAEKILSLSHAQADLLFDHAQRLVYRIRSCGAQAPAVVDLHADLSRPDKRAEASFGVRNPFGERADPLFHSRPFRTQTGDAVAGLDVRFSCEPDRVPPRGTGEIEISVGIASATGLEAGVYFAELDVALIGDEERRVARRLLRLRVRESHRVE